VVLVETQEADGSTALIVYRNGDAVSAIKLEQMCDKVHGVPQMHAAQACFLHGLASLHLVQAPQSQPCAACALLQGRKRCLAPGPCCSHPPLNTLPMPPLPPLSQVGRPRRLVAKVEAALANSILVASVQLEVQLPGGAASSEEARVIGLARATSDHAFNATV